MKIVTNKYNYISSYAKVGDLDGSFELEYDFNDKDPLDFQYINKKLIYNPIPKKPIGINLIYTGSEWIELAPLEEQEAYYRTLIISKTRELEDMKNAGFGSPKLIEEIEELKIKHKEVSHALTLQ